MLLADVTFSDAGIIIIAGLLSVVTGALGYIFKLLLKAQNETLTLTVKQYEDRLLSEQSQKKSYKEMFDELFDIVNTYIPAVAKGRPKPLASVVPESHSPVTEEQQATADLQTDRARLTEVVLALGLPARVSGPPETKEQQVARLAKERRVPVDPPSNGAELDQMRSDISKLQEGTVRADIAEVKEKVEDVEKAVAETPEKTAAIIEKKKEEG